MGRWDQPADAPGQAPPRGPGAPVGLILVMLALAASGGAAFLAWNGRPWVSALGVSVALFALSWTAEALAKRPKP